MNKIPAFLTCLVSLVIYSSLASSQSIEDLYTLVRPVQPTQTPGKVEVIEIFSYGCGGCYRFEPVISRWLETAPEEVAFRRMPAVFQSGWDNLGKAYYTAIKLGIIDDLHHKIFEAIHKDKRNLFTEHEIKNLFIENGVDERTFDRAFNSMEIKTKVKQADVMNRKYKAAYTPTIIINGKYLVLPSDTNGIENLFEVLDELVAREIQNL